MCIRDRMKGYTEYLSHNVPLGRISEDKLMDTIHNLSLATDRLEQYANLSLIHI